MNLKTAYTAASFLIAFAGALLGGYIYIDDRFDLLDKEHQNLVNEFANLKSDNDSAFGEEIGLRLNPINQRLYNSQSSIDDIQTDLTTLKGKVLRIESNRKGNSPGTSFDQKQTIENSIEYSEFENRVNKLEGEIRTVRNQIIEMGSNISKSSVVSQTPTRTGVEVRGIRLEVLKFELLKDKNISMIMELENKTRSVKHFAFGMSGTSTYTAICTDENKNELIISKVNGSGGTWRNDWISEPFSSGEKRTIRIRLVPAYSSRRSTALLGKKYSFTTDLFILQSDDDGKATRNDKGYYVPISQLNFFLDGITPTN